MFHKIRYIFAKCEKKANATETLDESKTSCSVTNFFADYAV